MSVSRDEAPLTVNGPDKDKMVHRKKYNKPSLGVRGTGDVNTSADVLVSFGTLVFYDSYCPLGLYKDRKIILHVRRPPFPAVVAVPRFYHARVCFDNCV